MIAFSLVILVILSFESHSGYAEIRIPKAARKYKTKAGFQNDVFWLAGIQRHLVNINLKSNLRYHIGILGFYLHTIIASIIMDDWVQCARDLETLLSMKPSEESLAMVSSPPWSNLTSALKSIQNIFSENGFKELDFIGNIDQYKEFIKTDSSMLGDSFWSDQLADNKILQCLPEFRLGGAKCKVRIRIEMYAS